MPVPLGLWRLHKEELETFPGLSVMSFDVVEKEQQVFLENLRGRTDSETQEHIQVEETQRLTLSFVVPCVDLFPWATIGSLHWQVSSESCPSKGTCGRADSVNGVLSRSQRAKQAG